MSYVKYGVTTKIKLINSNNQTYKYVKDSFDLSLFNKNDNSYYLKSDVLSDNLKWFRKEILRFTEGCGDSLDNCEAYCLNTDVDSLLNNKILLFNDNEKYYFSSNKYFKFEADQVVILDGLIGIKLYLIPVFWDVNRVEYENYITIANFINKLIRTSTSNILKGASFFVVV